jgi:hypothetical protein
MLKLTSNCGENMKKRCKGREERGMDLKCVLKYNKNYLIYILDRINRIFWISFLRHFPEESGETQSRPMSGKKSHRN